MIFTDTDDRLVTQPLEWVESGLTKCDIWSHYKIRLRTSSESRNTNEVSYIHLFVIFNTSTHPIWFPEIPCCRFSESHPTILRVSLKDTASQNAGSCQFVWELTRTSLLHKEIYWIIFGYWMITGINLLDNSFWTI